MSYVHPAWLEHQRKRFTRADAYRLAPPGSPEAKPPGWLDPSATRVRLKEAQEEEARARAAAEQEEFERELLQLRWEVKKLKLDHELWLLRSRNTALNQPRVPAGTPEAGNGRAGRRQASSECKRTSAGANSIGAGAQANVIPICVVGSKMITTDRFGNQSWWADYVCADGFTFRRFGPGGRVRGLWVDPR